MFDIGISSSMWHNMYIPQHIYFLSHRKYERGDWVLFSNEIVRATAEMVRLRNAAKVEASTDASLKVYKIPTSFVQRYVLRGGQIHEQKLKTNTKGLIINCGFVVCEQPSEFSIDEVLNLFMRFSHRYCGGHTEDQLDWIKRNILKID